MASVAVLVGCGGDAGATRFEAVGGGAASTGMGSGGSGGDGGPPYQPDPIPELDDEPPPLCDDPLPNTFQFMHDGCESKRYPSYVDRELACPVSDDSAVIALAGGGEAVYQPSGTPPLIEGALSDIVPAELHVTAILIRRVGGVPHYRYLSNGSHDIAYQPWSTSKFLAAANAAARLRIASGGGVGLTASVDSFPLGDLVTSVHNYDYAPYSSNAIGRYFHNIGGRDRANDLIHELWLQRPAAETFGGNYGEVEPPLGYTFVESSGPAVTIQPDTSFGYPNHMSSFTMAEAIKRLVLHREEPAEQLPGIEWPDVATLLYGAADSTQYGSFGGMSDDRAVYFQSAHDIDYIEARSRGRWRIFSKLGLGSGGQFLDVGYACLPVLDDDDQPVVGWGRELVIAAHLSSGGASWAERDRLLAKAIRAIVIRVVDGRL